MPKTDQAGDHWLRNAHGEALIGDWPAVARIRED